MMRRKLRTYSCDAREDVREGAISQGRGEGGLGSGVGPEVRGTCGNDPHEGGRQATEKALDTWFVIDLCVDKCVCI